MTSLNAAFNYPFASAEAARVANAERGADEAVTAQLKQAASSSAFQVGSTITARYQYQVAPDGSLIPIQTQITTDAPDDALRGGSQRKGGRAYREDERRSNLREFLKPKAELTPADELALFADGEAPGVTVADLAAQESQQQALKTSNQGAVTAEVLDENGNPVEAQILRQNTTQESKSAFNRVAARLQFSVAGLYARNSEISYNITPLASFAA